MRGSPPLLPAKRRGQSWRGRAGRAPPCLCPRVIDPPADIAGADLPESGRWLWSPPGPPETTMDAPGTRAFSPRPAPPCMQPPEALPLRSLHGFPPAPAPCCSLCQDHASLSLHQFLFWPSDDFVSPLPCSLLGAWTQARHTVGAQQTFDEQERNEPSCLQHLLCGVCD